MKMNKMIYYKIFTLLLLMFSVLWIGHTVLAASPTPPCDPTSNMTNPANAATPTQPCVQVSEQGIGFHIPNLSDILTFAIRAIFIMGGLAALLFLLLGAFSWIISAGDKEKVAAAQSKIQAAVLGVILIAVVLAVAVTLEQIVFNKRLCFGLSCPLTIPSLIQAPQ